MTLHDDPIGQPISNEGMILQTDYDFVSWEAAAQFAHAALTTKAGLPYNGGRATVALIEHCCEHAFDVAWMWLRPT